MAGRVRGSRVAIARRCELKGGATAEMADRSEAIEVCSFTKGLFEDTLAGLGGPVDVALLDGDLVASTRTFTFLP